jgi:hypothetical protein
VPQKHDFVEILKRDVMYHVCDMSFEIDFGACEVYSFA